VRISRETIMLCLDRGNGRGLEERGCEKFYEYYLRVFLS
jgi:hypothetical protein